MFKEVLNTPVFRFGPGNILGHHNKHLMGYFKFLYYSIIICLPLNISGKSHWQHFFENLEEAETHRLHLCYDAIRAHLEKQHLSFKQTRTTTIFSLGYQSCTWLLSSPVCRQNPCSGCNSKIDLVIVLEYTNLELCFNTEQIS